MSRVLVLSRHSGPLDRRIIAEINTLAASGREVTLVSTAAVLPEACLDTNVRVVMPAPSRSGSVEWLKHATHKLPPRLRALVRAAWYRFGQGPVPCTVRYFLQMTPPEMFDVIHCHDLDTLPAAVALRDMYCPGATLIYDAHELFPFQFQDRTWQRYWSEVEAEHITAADLVITVNESVAKELVQQYHIPQPTVIYNSYGVPSRREAIDEKTFLEHFGAHAGGFRVMFQGQFVREKNLEQLVMAFQWLRDSTQLFLLGDGPIETSLKKLCRRLGLANVFFGPWVPQQDLLAYVSHADLGIIPYSGSTLLNNRYCTPNKLFEFIEADVPICASDLPELRRFVKDNGIGDVYVMEDPAAIARAIEACRCRCVQGGLTTPALQVARDKYAWTWQGKKLMQLYETMGV